MNTPKDKHLVAQVAALRWAKLTLAEQAYGTFGYKAIYEYYKSSLETSGKIGKF